jgi:hypothetical protein
MKCKKARERVVSSGPFLPPLQRGTLKRMHTEIASVGGALCPLATL